MPRQITAQEYEDRTRCVRHKLAVTHTISNLSVLKVNVRVHVRRGFYIRLWIAKVLLYALALLGADVSINAERSS